MEPTAELRARVARILGTEPVKWTAARSFFRSPLFVVKLGDGSGAFVKAAGDEDSAKWLRQEHNVYVHLHGDFMPELLGWEDDAKQPLLVLEDLSGAHWPPPWSDERGYRVTRTLERIAEAEPPPGLGSLEVHRELLSGWTRVSEDPAPFLGLGLVSDAWFEGSLPLLLRLEKEVVLEGEDLLHLDARSDNLCFQGNRTIFVDWNWACIGNRRLDLAYFLATLQGEGGPPPESVMPDGSDMAPVIAGFFASFAGRPVNPEAPRLRPAQLRSLRAALPWAVRCLDLPPLDGPNAPSWM